MDTPWILRHPRPATTAQRLLCFPYAGGGAAVYLPWCGKLGSNVEVVPIQLPGRETRMREAAHDHIDSLLRDCVPALGPVLDAPFAVYGHSMGSLIAFEFVRELARRQLPLPRMLLVSGRRPPHLEDTAPPLSYLPDDEFLAGLESRYGAQFPAELRDLVELMLPTMRADVRLVDTYRFQPSPRLSLPIVMLTGLADASVPLDDAKRWGELTDGPFDLHTFEGGHFFPTAERDRFLDTVRRVLPHAAH